jgi:8-oxo-dGTP pyrophosphatase MutT (NUDIX family)
VCLTLGRCYLLFSTAIRFNSAIYRELSNLSVRFSRNIDTLLMSYRMIMDKADLLARIMPHLSWPASLGNSINETVGISSVVVIIHFTRSSPHVLLTKRSSNLRLHGGEISFPGGRYTKEDENLVNTAIRETGEEIGIKLTAGDILGSLKAVKTLTSNFYIFPFVSILQNVDQPIPFADEVEAVLDLPLVSLLSTMSADTEHVSIDELYKFNYDSYLIWGATARILKQLNDFIIPIR